MEVYKDVSTFLTLSCLLVTKVTKVHIFLNWLFSLLSIRLLMAHILSCDVHIHAILLASMNKLS